MTEFVFRELGDRQLHFVGDFDGLYRNEQDPWQQSSSDGPLGRYNVHSRARLLTVLRRYGWQYQGWKGLEVGCGHGQVTALLADAFPQSLWRGIDISYTAVVKANEGYHHSRYSFACANILDAETLVGLLSSDVIIFSQMFWYVLHDIDRAVNNAYHLLNPKGLFIVSQAFLKEQRYGKEIADGFPGTVRLFIDRYADKLELVYACYDNSGKFVHNDGILVFQRKG